MVNICLITSGSLHCRGFQGEVLGFGRVWDPTAGVQEPWGKRLYPTGMFDMRGVEGFNSRGR